MIYTKKLLLISCCRTKTKKAARKEIPGSFNNTIIIIAKYLRGSNYSALFKPTFLNSRDFAVLSLDYFAFPVRQAASVNVFPAKPGSSFY